MLALARALFLMLNLGAGMWRVLRGSTVADRMLAEQLFGTNAVAIRLLLAEASASAALRDVALGVPFQSRFLPAWSPPGTARVPFPLVRDTTQLYLTGELVVDVQHIADGGLAPWDNPDGRVNAAYVLIASQLVLRLRTGGTL